MLVGGLRVLLWHSEHVLCPLGISPEPGNSLAKFKRRARRIQSPDKRGLAIVPVPCGGSGDRERAQAEVDRHERPETVGVQSRIKPAEFSRALTGFTFLESGGAFALSGRAKMESCDSTFVDDDRSREAARWLPIELVSKAAASPTP
jgi:hypothetical protein